MFGFVAESMKSLWPFRRKFGNVVKLHDCVKPDTFHYKTLIFVNFCMPGYTRSLRVSAMLKGLLITFFTCTVNWVNLKTVYL